MTQKQAQKKLNNLYDLVREEVGSSTMDLIHEIVKLELLLEKESNQ